MRTQIAWHVMRASTLSSTAPHPSHRPSTEHQTRPRQP
jgi:hypothetical protein